MHVTGVKFKINVALLARCALFFTDTLFHVFNISLLGEDAIFAMRHARRVENIRRAFKIYPQKIQRKVAQLENQCKLEQSVQDGYHDKKSCKSLLRRFFVPKHILQLHELGRKIKQNKGTGCPYFPCSRTKKKIIRIVLCPPVSTLNIKSIMVDKPRSLEQTLHLISRPDCAESVQITLGAENGLCDGHTPNKSDILTYIPMYGETLNGDIKINRNGVAKGSLNMVSAIAIALFRFTAVIRKGFLYPNGTFEIAKRKLSTLFVKSEAQWDPNFGPFLRNCFHMGVATVFVIGPKISEGSTLTRKDREFNPRGAIGAEHSLHIVFLLYRNPSSNERAELRPIAQYISGNIEFYSFINFSSCMNYIISKKMDLWALETDYPILTPLSKKISSEASLASISCKVNLEDISQVQSMIKACAADILMCVPEEGHLLPPAVAQRCNVLLSKDKNASIYTDPQRRGLGSALTVAIALYSIRVAMQGG